MKQQPPSLPFPEAKMTKMLLALAAASATLIAATAHAQTAPPVDPHAGHGAAAASSSIQPAAPVDPHAGHDMAAMNPTAMQAGGTALKASSPADGATVSSLREISLTLPHAMMIQSINLTNAAGQRVPLNATLPAAPAEVFTVPVPALTPGAYKVSWKAGADDHAMSGSFGFAVQ